MSLVFQDIDRENRWRRGLSSHERIMCEKFIQYSLRLNGVRRRFSPFLVKTTRMLYYPVCEYINLQISM